jgi:hypothetical protein
MGQQVAHAPFVRPAACSESADMKHKILGGVSSKVAWNAPCSVLLVGPVAARE